MLDQPNLSVAGSESDSYLPDLCNGEIFLRLLLVVELTAIVFALVSYQAGSLYPHIALISMMMLWIGLSGAMVLCGLRRAGWLNKHWRTTAAAFSVVLSLTALVSILAHRFGPLLSVESQDSDLILDTARNLAIAVILVGLALRHFYLHHQSDQRLKTEAHARLQALQARIRPHFLFNSMNTIASLTHDNPDLAEKAIENLSDLFRASLAAESSISLQQELELTRSYIDLESLRLGERLVINWQLPKPAPVLNLPALTLQPLVENAIYHGIEPIPEGGSIDIDITPKGHQIEISISNPVGVDDPTLQRAGNSMAVENIRERLALAYGGAASMQLDETEQYYCVKLYIPTSEAA